jgi:hypothetical protein
MTTGNRPVCGVCGSVRECAPHSRDSQCGECAAALYRAAHSARSTRFERFKNKPECAEPHAQNPARSNPERN